MGENGNSGRFSFLGLQNNCGWWLKPWNWKKSYEKPRQCIKKQSHHLPTKVHIVKAMVFPVVMCECESWTIKKAEHQTDAFELWCWRRLLRFSWTARKSNELILKEINPDYYLEGLMLKLKLNNFATRCENMSLWKRPWCWERLRVGREGGDRDGWMASSTQWTWVWPNSGG